MGSSYSPINAQMGQFGLPMFSGQQYLQPQVYMQPQVVEN